MAISSYSPSLWATPRAATVAQRPARNGVLRWAFPLVLGLYPLWWLLGVNAFTWMVVAIPMGAWLISRRRNVVAPRSIGVWLLFLAWVALSAVNLQGASRDAAAFYRGACYLSATVFLLFVANASEDLLSTRSITIAMTTLWGWCIGLSVIALVFPTLAFTSPLEKLLPGSVANIPFVHAMIHPAFAGHDLLVGVNRPRPMFPYTNNWGSAVGMLVPIVVYTLLKARTRLGKGLLIAGLAVSVAPVIISINRGLWISIGVAALYVTVRLIARGHVKALWMLCGVAGLLAVATFATPLGQVIDARLHASNTSTRETLYQSSLAVVQHSPVLGYGSPVSSAGIYDSNDASVGTHGQFWTVLVSQGYPGAILFVGFFVLMIALTWRVSNHGLWLHAVLIVALVQLPFYDPLPVGLCLTFACMALCVRDVRRVRAVGNQRGRHTLNSLTLNARGAQ